MTGAPPNELRRPLARVYLCAVIATALVAVVVLAGFTARARRWLDLPFTGIPATPAQAQEIFVNNVRVALAAFAAAVAVNARWLTRHHAATERGWRTTRLVCDLLVAIPVASNVLVVGAALGAYRWPMVAATLPHGPVELFAFSLALSLYLLARRGPVAARTWAFAAIGVAVSLAAGAVLEVFVSL